MAIINVQHTVYVHHKYQKFLRHLNHKNMEGVCLCVNEKDQKKKGEDKSQSVPNHPGAASAAFRWSLFIYPLARIKDARKNLR